MKPKQRFKQRAIALLTGLSALTACQTPPPNSTVPLSNSSTTQVAKKFDVGLDPMDPCGGCPWMITFGQTMEEAQATYPGATFVPTWVEGATMQGLIGTDFYWLIPAGAEPTPVPTPTPGLSLTSEPSFTPEWDGVNDWASIEVTVPTSNTSWLLTANAHPIAAGTGDANVTWFGIIGKSFRGNGIYKLELSSNGQSVSRDIEIINGPSPFNVKTDRELWATSGNNFGSGLPDGRNETFGARVRRAGEKEEEVGWGRPKTWNMDKLAEHYEKHVKVRGEFGKIDEVTYWTKAERICEVGDGPRHVTNGVLKGTRTNNNYTVYLQEEQGTIVFVDEIGYIQSMFKPGFRKGISQREQKKLARDYFDKYVDRLIE